METRNEDVKLGDQPNKQQIELHEVLVEIDSVAADIYRSALLALTQSENPGRFAHCAHDLRELIERLTNYSEEVPVLPEGPDVNSLLFPIQDAWIKLVSGSLWPGDVEWGGEIDDTLREFLRKCETQIPKIAETRKTFRLRASGLVERYNFHAVPLPSHLVEPLVKELLVLRRYFVKVAHSGYEIPEEREFHHNVTSLEEFILKLLKPRTVKKRGEIISLVLEAENAES